MPNEIEPFYAMKIGQEAIALEEAGQSVIHMEYGQPTAAPPASILKRAQSMLEAGVPGYWESQRLKDAIADDYRRTFDVDIDSRRIILTCGASPALTLSLLCSFKPGDQVAIARPGYIAYRNSLRGLHMEPVELACDSSTDYQLTAGMIEALDPVPAGLILASPANPTGSIIKAEELKAIVQVCRERNIRIVADEIYNRIVYNGSPQSIAPLTDDACVINSFSKFYMMPGWRLGWALVPEDLAAKAYALMSNLFLTPPSLSQAAALEALHCTDELNTRVESYRRNREALLTALPKLGLRDIAPPDGAFYIYSRIDHLTGDSRDLCMTMLRDIGVATTPGIDFDPVDGHRFMRFSFAVTEAEVAEAIERLTPWFEERFGSLSLSGGA